MDNLQRELDRQDYLAVVATYDIPIEMVEEQYLRDDDVVFEDPEGLELKASPIQGLGMFTTRAFPEGEFMGMARTTTDRSEIGRYVNHSSEPNCVMRHINQGVGAIALRDIAAGEEMLCDYRHPELMIVNVETEED